jgi:hypothetical protein
MADRGLDQDKMVIGRGPRQDEDYWSAGGRDEEEVHDLGFIVEDHDDRRGTLTEHWQRLDELDTDEPLETNRSGPIPKQVGRQADPHSPEEFASDYHLQNAEAEAQEEDFARASMLLTDPDMDEDAEDFTSHTLETGDHRPLTTDITGHVTGVGYGFGTSLPQDGGEEGFEVRDNPLMQRQGAPVSGGRVSDEARGLRDVDEMGSEDELDWLAERAAQQMEAQGDADAESLHRR